MTDEAISSRGSLFASEANKEPRDVSRALARVRVRVTGTVQGVGFRPFVYRLAGELGLAGWVLNDERGVLVEVEGEAQRLDRFFVRLREEAPLLARIEGVAAEEVEPSGESGFEIVASAAAGEVAVPVAPDSATCEACLAELRNPADRRHRYPFVNCTDCGPRFTIVTGVPYDRARTTMAGFEMCDACRAEYVDPADRRFHAEPNACPSCGPRARLVHPGGTEGVADLWDRIGPKGLPPPPGAGAPDAVGAAAAALLDGAIVAIKGLGGYHLACRADAEGPVARLRARKHREEKPFALLVVDLDRARELAEIGTAEAELLSGPQRPIVLARRRPSTGLAAALAPRRRELGLMLPYSPLHHLLAGDCGVPLVLTSGNVSEEPIAYRDEEALQRLAPIADLFLVHDRPIETRTDDSVLRPVRLGGAAVPLQLRRSRGYVPAALPLPREASRPLLACGAELKSTFCLAKGSRAWVGHHIGDLENYETLRSFRDGVEHFQRLFAVAPVLVAHDLHPDYLSTAYALEREGVETLGVQHHHAHLAAGLAEHGETGPALGAIFDGTGYGPDGTVWGGELLAGDLGGFERAGGLAPVAMPGGVAAIREPWRMACAWTAELGGDGAPLPTALAGQVSGRDWRNCRALLGTTVGSPTTTSMGRLFDAAGALCGCAARVSYEGQAAVELEAIADRAERGRYELELRREEGLPSEGTPPRLLLNPRPALAALLADLAAGVPPAAVAARFHEGVARATATACAALAAERDLDTVVLSGGVFQNALLLERTAALLVAGGLRALVPRLLPPNDGGISYGQAAIAAATR
ncbi:MAG: carbamoyltransferase HypF [Solirubrobacterales bacterium]